MGISEGVGSSIEKVQQGAFSIILEGRMIAEDDILSAGGEQCLNVQVVGYSFVDWRHLIDIEQGRISRWPDTV